ncbi:MAG: hypothetical protein RLN62_00660 [Rickettsiales bacterium]
MPDNNLPGVLLIFQINEGALNIFNLEGWNMEKALNAIGESSVFKIMFPNVPAASAFLGQLMEKSGGKLGVIKEVIKTPKIGTPVAPGGTKLPGVIIQNKNSGRGA